MFTGTMLYRAEQRQVRRKRAAIIVIGIFTAAIAAGAWHIPSVSMRNQIPLQQRE